MGAKFKESGYRSILMSGAALLLVCACGVIEKISPTATVPPEYLIPNVPTIPTLQVIIDYCRQFGTPASNPAAECWVVPDGFDMLTGADEAVLFEQDYRTPLGARIERGEVSPEYWNDEFTWHLYGMPLAGIALDDEGNLVSLDGLCEQQFISADQSRVTHQILISGEGDVPIFRDTPNHADRFAVEGELDPTDQAIALCVTLTQQPPLTE